MEPLWSPAVATGGSQWQMLRPRNRRRQAKTVAVGCDQSPETFHGKEGVDGSSPSEASSFACLVAVSVLSAGGGRGLRRVVRHEQLLAIEVLRRRLPQIGRTAAELLKGGRARARPRRGGRPRRGRCSGAACGRAGQKIAKPMNPRATRP